MFSFSHDPMKTEAEIMKFIADNEDFIQEIFETNGKTNLGIYYLRFKEEKAAAATALPEHAMIAPELHSQHP